MTEAEWLAADSPSDMLRFWNPKASERKLRLFNCGCCRRVWHLFSASVTRDAVEAAEKVADGLLNYNSAQPPLVISPELSRVILAVHAATDNHWTYQAVRGVLAVHRSHYGRAWDTIALGLDMENHEAANNEMWCQAGLLRCVSGNPFRPFTLDSTWLTSTVLTLANGIYSERAFDRMPILADALQDAGCENEDILNHCRQPGEHTRGCWVVDLLLDKK